MLVLQNNLMMAVVGNGQARRFMSIAKKAGAGGGTVIPAKGTASSNFLRLLGLGDKSREMVLIVIDREKADRIVEEVRNDGKIQGVAALLGSKKVPVLLELLHQTMCGLCRLSLHVCRKHSCLQGSIPALDLQLFLHL